MISTPLPSSSPLRSEYRRLSISLSADNSTDDRSSLLRSLAHSACLVLCSVAITLALLFVLLPRHPAANEWNVSRLSQGTVSATYTATIDAAIRVRPGAGRGGGSQAMTASIDSGDTTAVISRHVPSLLSRSTRPQPSADSDTLFSTRGGPRVTRYLSLGNVTSGLANATHVVVDAAVGGDGLAVMSYFANDSLVVGHCTDAACDNISQHKIAVSKSAADSLSGESVSVTLISGTMSKLAVGVDGLPVVLDFITRTSAALSASASTAPSPPAPLPVHFIRVTHCRDPACALYRSVVLNNWPLVGDACAIFGGIGIDQVGLVLFSFYDQFNATLLLGACQNVACSAVGVDVIYSPSEPHYGALDFPATCGNSHSFIVTPLQNGGEDGNDVRLSVASSVNGSLLYFSVEASDNGSAGMSYVYAGRDLNQTSSVHQMILPSGKSQMLYVRYVEYVTYGYHERDYSIEMTRSPTLLLGMMHPSSSVNFTCEPENNHGSVVSKPFVILQQYNNADGLPSIITYDLHLYTTGDFYSHSYVVIHCSDWQCSQIFTVEWPMAHPWSDQPLFDPTFAASIRPDGTPVYFFRDGVGRYRLVLCPNKTCTPYL